MFDPEGPSKPNPQICFVCIKLGIAPSKILWIIASSVALSTKKATLWGEHKVTWPSEPGRGQGAHILVLKPYSNRGDTISTFLFPSASPPKKFQTFLLLLHPTALGKVSFYYTAYQKTTVFEIFNLILIKNMYI